MRKNIPKHTSGIVLTCVVSGGLSIAAIWGTTEQKKEVPSTKYDITYDKRQPRYCTADLYEPLQVRDKLAPVAVVLVRGERGSGSNDDSSVDMVTSALLQEGFVVFRLNFHLSDESKNIVQCVDEVQQACAYLEANADKYRLNTNDLSVVGLGRGGFIALLAAYPEHHSGKGFRAAAAVAPVSYLTELRDALVQNHQNHMIGTTNRIVRRTDRQQKNTVNGKAAEGGIFIGSDEDQLAEFDLLKVRLAKPHKPVKILLIKGGQPSFSLEPTSEQSDVGLEIVRFLKAENSDAL